MRWREAAMGRPDGGLGVDHPPAAVAWGFGLILVADLERELLGVLDPAHDQLLGREEAHEPLPLIGLCHCACEILGLAITQLPHRIDPHFLQQAQIALAHAFDSHVVAGVGKSQQAFLIDAAPLSQSPARLGTFCLVQEPLRRADAMVSRVTAWTWPMLRPTDIMRVPAANTPPPNMPVPSSGGAAAMASWAPGILARRPWTFSAGPSFSRNCKIIPTAFWAVA